tara:strand:+ start:114 stop:482 length:369 start_codon:yes stop_codon:yes gene_type:complete
MSNVIDFVAAKEKIQKEITSEEGDINNEIKWALAEIEKINTFIAGLEEDLTHARDAKLEILSYHAGMVMAKHILEGNDINMFWSKEDDVDTLDKLEEALEELETTRETVNGIARCRDDEDDD